MQSQRRIIWLLLLTLVPMVGWAQEETYMDRLQQRSASGGVVVVHQDAAIEELVNGTGRAARVVRDTLATHPRTNERSSGPHTKANGYRVQIYMAGNTANDKAVAKSHAKRFKTFYPTVNAYVRFSSPHWVCEVGDFRTQAEANEFLKRVRAQFRTSYVVRSKVNEFK